MPSFRGVGEKVLSLEFVTESAMSDFKAAVTAQVSINPVQSRKNWALTTKTPPFRFSQPIYFHNRLRPEDGKMLTQSNLSRIRLRYTECIYEQS